jgi:hypothetical protein
MKRCRMNVVRERPVAPRAQAKYPAWRAAQVGDLRAAIQAADAGEFASEADIRAVFEHYGARPSSKRRRTGAIRDGRRS